MEQNEFKRNGKEHIETERNQYFLETERNQFKRNGTERKGTEHIWIFVETERNGTNSK